MLHIKILSVGKTKEKWLEDALQEYLKRLKPLATIEFIWAKNDEQLIALAEKEDLVVCLDPHGAELNSVAFAKFVHKKLEDGGSRLTFVIGGAEGLPAKLKTGCTLISLSKLTLTHQITRLVLIEQLYRAFEIAKGTKYHK